MAVRRLIIYGGRGELGTACVNHFKQAKYWVANVDLNPNEEADVNIPVTNTSSWLDQEAEVTKGVAEALDGEKVEGVLCVSGGFARGNASNDLCKSSDDAWKQSVWPSSIAAVLATKHLNDGGLLALTGAKACLGGTPGMMGYGMAKAAVHQLTKSLGSPGSGLPEKAIAVAVLPITLDTEANRKMLPNSDYSLWTPLSYVCNLFDQWLQGIDRPFNGTLVTLMSKEAKENYLNEYSIYGAKDNVHQTDMPPTVDTVEN